MAILKRNIDNVSVMNATHFAKSRVNSTILMASKFQCDSSRELRLQGQLCIACFYSDRIGGAAMTDSTCGLCDFVMHFSNTDINVLCNDCAIEHDLCAHCGGDIDMKQRKKQRF